MKTTKELHERVQLLEHLWGGRDTSTINVYEMQISTLIEDFRQEKEDKQKHNAIAIDLERQLSACQSQSEMLSHQIAMLKQEIGSLKQNNDQLVIAQRRADAIINYERYKLSRRIEPRYSCDDGSNNPDSTVAEDIADSAN